jgi:hypothetical protein
VPGQIEGGAGDGRNGKFADVGDLVGPDALLAHYDPEALAVVFGDDFDRR